MKIVIGLLLIVLGIALGLYVGIWVMAIGGVVQVIHAFQAHPIDAVNVGIGVVRFFCSTLVGGASAWLLILPGIGMIGLGVNEPRRGFRGF